MGRWLLSWMRLLRILLALQRPGKPVKQTRRATTPKKQKNNF
jgi:hypothetical protein